MVNKKYKSKRNACHLLELRETQTIDNNDISYKDIPINIDSNKSNITYSNDNDIRKIHDNIPIT